MSKGRPADPSRARRGTGNRPKPGEAKVAKPVPIVPGATTKDVAQVDPFPPPATLPDEVAAVWRAAVSDLGGANHMRESYIPTLEAYCNAVYVHAQAIANIQQYGVLVKGPHGPVTNPLLKVQKDASATMLRYAETLGLTPAARVRVGLMEVTGMSLLAGIGQAIEGKR
jgi:P27 family predicted phage terminase small subunit